MKRHNSSLYTSNDDSDDDHSQNLDNNSDEELERSSKKVKRTSDTQPSSPSAASASSSTDQTNDQNIVVVGAEPLEEYDDDNNSVDTSVSESYLTDYFNNDHAPGNVDYYRPLRNYDDQELFANLPVASNQDDDEYLYSGLPLCSRTETLSTIEDLERLEMLVSEEDLGRVEDEDADQVMTNALPEEHPSSIEESLIVDIILQGIRLWQERGTGDLNDCIRDILQRLSLDDEEEILPIISKFLSSH